MGPATFPPAHSFIISSDGLPAEFRQLSPRRWLWRRSRRGVCYPGQPSPSWCQAGAHVAGHQFMLRGRRRRRAAASGRARMHAAQAHAHAHCKRACARTHTILTLGRERILGPVHRRRHGGGTGTAHPLSTQDRHSVSNICQILVRY